MRDKSPRRQPSDSARRSPASGNEADTPAPEEVLPEDRPDPVEEASMDSFPASDPPSWEPLHAGDPDEEPRPEERPDRREDR